MGNRISTAIDPFDRFKDEDDCLDHLYTVKYPKDYTWPKCTYKHGSILYSHRKVQCTQCSHQEFLTAHTVMVGRSHIALKKWF